MRWGLVIFVWTAACLQPGLDVCAESGLVCPDGFVCDQALNQCKAATCGDGARDLVEECDGTDHRGWNNAHRGRGPSLPLVVGAPAHDIVAAVDYQVEQFSALENKKRQMSGLSGAEPHLGYDCKRVNVAAIGNLVPQLHLHIIARTEDDPCWPDVVRGQSLPEAMWTADSLRAISMDLAANFAITIGA